MELSGDLSDFALTDILQILALSRKTGTLALQSGDTSAVIVIERGRITQAKLDPGESLAEQLVREKLVSRDSLGRLTRIGQTAGAVWTLRTLILESGVLAADQLEAAVRRHICQSVGSLVRLEKGRFGIALNQKGAGDTLDEVSVHQGLDIGEVLLSAAKDLDEYSREEAILTAASLGALDQFNDEDGMSELDGISEVMPGENDPREYGEFAGDTPGSSRGERSALLCSLLAELRSHSFEAEVSLLVMRYASEVATRGVLFVVRDDKVCGLGQFGVEKSTGGKGPDDLVRELRIPLGAKSIFDHVVRTGQPYIGNLTDNYWHSELLKRIGGNGMPLSAFALPLICNDEPIFVFYGDNYPGQSALTGIDELVALINQASVVLEKMVLQRMLEELKHPSGNAGRAAVS